MRLNIPIIFDQLKEFSPNIRCSKDLDSNLSQVRIFHENVSCVQKEYLYLADSQTIERNISLFAGCSLIAFGNIDDQFAEENQLSLITFTDTNNQEVIFEKVQQIFEKYNLWHQKLLYSIVKREPLQSLLDIGASVLTNPIALFDYSLALLAKSGQLPEDYSGTIWDYVLSKGFSPVELYSETDQKIIFKQLQETHKPFFYKDPQRFPKNRHLGGSILKDGKLAVIIGLVDINQPFTTGQLSLIYRLMGILELAFANNPNLEGNAEGAFYYIDKLLKGLEVEKKVLKYHLSQKKWHVEDYYCIYNFSLPKGKSLHKNLSEAYLFRIKSVMEDAMIFPYENSIIAISREEDQKGGYELICDELDLLLEMIGLKCGISTVFSGFDKLKYYYIQSKAALTEGEQKDQNFRQYHFLDYYLPHIINTLNNVTSLGSLCHQNVLKLKEYSILSGHDYLGWLLTYLINGLNVSKTAQKLFVHRNTMVYRIEKIKEILDIELDELEEAKVIYLIFSCIICINS